MRALAAFLGLMGLASSPAAADEFLLNCRFIDSSHPIYRQHCKAETKYLVATECDSSGICIIKIQNFKGAYSVGEGLSVNGVRTDPSIGDTVATAGNPANSSVSNVIGKSRIASTAALPVNPAVAAGAVSQAGSLTHELGAQLP
jgi:hypothetical protein